MPGRHRRPSHTSLRLARVGALTVMATAPLALTGTALAAPSNGGDHGEPSRWALRADDELTDHDDAGQSDESDDSSKESVDELPTWSDHRPSWSDSDSEDDSTQAVRAHAAPARTTGRSVPESARTPAQDAKWDRLAQCESGQNWDANTGNSYKGGLQFSDSTWRAYGGREYAPSADQASREQQIAVAKKVQREQGWHAWPSCSKRLGYT